MVNQISVIGLNQIGISMGLALKKSEKDLFLVGSDPEIEVEQKAAKLNAFDRIVHNMADAIKEADMVILNAAVDELQEMIQAVAVNLKPGAVVLVTAPLHVQTLQWAKECLPTNRHLLMFTPSINPDFLNQSDTASEVPSEEFFHKGSIAISSTVEENAGSIQLALDLASLLKADPIIFDPYEADGVLAWARLLPYLNAAIMFRAASNQPGWKEAQKLADVGFFNSTLPLTIPMEKENLGKALLIQSENSIRLVDTLIDELKRLRKVISDQDSQALQAFLEAPGKQRLHWIQTRATGVWEKNDVIPTPTAFNLKSMFGFGKKTDNHPKQ